MNVTSPRGAIGANLWHHAIQAARETGVRLYNLRESGKGIAFTLKTGDHAYPRIDWRGREVLSPKYQRLSQLFRRSTARGFEGEEYAAVVPGAVCWHGHRDFLRALYARVPDARVRTAFITYRDAEHFERSFESTRNGAVEKARGVAFVSMANQYADACTCDEA